MVQQSALGGLRRKGGFSRRVATTALLCQAFGFWALVVLVFALVLYRLERIDAVIFLWSLGATALLASLAFFLAFPAMRQFFEEDALGVGAVARGVIFASIAAAPLVWYGAQAIVHPRLNDISTDVRSPPQFVALAVERRAQAFVNDDERAFDAGVQAQAYPQVGPHRYSTNVSRVGEAVGKLLAERRWRLLAEPDLPSVEPLEEGAIPLPTSPVPQEQFRTGQTYVFEAVERSLIVREPSDIVIRLTQDGTDDSGQDRTLVDMRVAVRHTAHDFGRSAQVIESFLADLDVELLGVAGEALVNEAADDDQ